MGSSKQPPREERLSTFDELRADVRPPPKRRSLRDAQAQQLRKTLGLLTSPDEEFLIDLERKIWVVTDHQGFVRLEAGLLDPSVPTYGLRLYDNSGSLVFEVADLVNAGAQQLAHSLTFNVTEADVSYDAWVLPSGDPGDEGYTMGQRVAHNQQVWQVTQVNASGYNIWQPGVFGWTMITPSVTWSSGNIVLQNGNIYSISAGSAVMSSTAVRYIYFDADVSPTTLLVTTVVSDVVGPNAYLLATAQRNIGNDLRAKVVPVVGTPRLASSSLTVDAVQTVHLRAGSVTAAKVNVGMLSEITQDAGIIVSGQLRNAAGTRFIDLDATGSQPFIQHNAMTLRADGSATFSGTVSASQFTAPTANFLGVISIAGDEVQIQGSLVGGPRILSGSGHHLRLSAGSGQQVQVERLLNAQQGLQVANGATVDTLTVTGAFTPPATLTRTGNLTLDPSGTLVLQTSTKPVTIAAGSLALTNASLSGSAGGVATYLNVNVNGIARRIPLHSV